MHLLTSIDYVAPPGAAWPNLRMEMVPSDPFDPLQIRNVTGLEPVTATINTKGYGVVDGEFYVGSSVPKRNIVITLALNTIAGATSVAGARAILYRYFLPKNAVHLQFNFSDRDPVMIEGYVESLTGDRFVQDPEMQLSVICPQPNFQAITPTVVTGDSSSSDTPNEEETLYIGDASSGIIFEMDAGGSSVFSGDLEIRSELAGSLRTMTFNGIYIPQDWTLVVDTRQGHKIVEARPPEDDDSDPINQFAQMDDITFWLKFFAGTQTLSVKATGVTRVWRITYTDQFVGV